MRVAIVGLGNIGAAAVPLVARMPGISEIVLVDPDDYAETNLSSQAIEGAAIGKPKVGVQAAVVAGIDPAIRVAALAERVENVPLGLLRRSILVACVDNRRARQAVNRIAKRCGSAWIDAAVGAPSLVRIGVFAPGRSAACIECGWDDAAYELLEQEYACAAEAAAIPATAAPAELGVLAASWQAIELRKLTDPVPAQHALAGAQLLIDTHTHAQHVNRIVRNAHCRFDHASWSDIEQVDVDCTAHTLGDLFAAADAGRDAAIGIDGHRFAMYLDCRACGRRRSVGLALYGRLDEAARTCDCGGRLLAAGFFSFETIRRSELSRASSDLKLAALGLRARDVVSLAEASGRTRHLEIAGGAADD